MRRIALLILAGIAAISSSYAALPTVTLPYGGIGQSYAVEVSLKGVYSWSFYGLLPEGMYFTEDVYGHRHGIAGTPQQTGAFRLTILGSDPALFNGNQGTETVYLYVMDISTPSQLPNSSVCSPYSLTFAAEFAPPPPIQWSLTTPTPLPGLILDPNTGILSGSPTSGGNFNFVIEALIPSGVYATKSFSLSIASFCLNPTLPDGDANSPYHVVLTPTGGTAPFRFATTGALPFGVSIDANSGVMAGTPTVSGKYTFSVQVTDSTTVTTTQSFTVNINPALAFTTTSPLAAGTARANYSETFSAAGGLAPYVFATSDPPPGLQLSQNGILSGTPSAGSFTMTVTVTDSLNYTVSMDYTVNFISATILQVSPMALTFSAIFEGDAPAPKSIAVVPVAAPPDFKVLIDGGAGMPAPSWIKVTQVTASAPARLIVSVDQGKLPVQTAQARVQVMDDAGTAMVVQVTLNIVSGAPRLQLVPDTLRFAARAANPGTLVETVGIRNVGGGGAVSFQASAAGNSSWITGVTPSSGKTVPNSTSFVQVQINTQGLQPGSYRDTLRFSSGSSTVSIPVTLFVSGSGLILQLSATGERFQARVGGGFSNPQVLEILNTGDSGSGLAWTAELVNGSQYFSLSASQGNATPSTPGSITLMPRPAALAKPAGSYYGLLKVSSPQAVNSPLYAVLVLDLADASTPALPDPSPAGVVFVGTAGQSLSATQTVSINTSASSPAPFQAAAATADGGGWLTVDPSSGSVTGQSPQVLTLSADATKLAAEFTAAKWRSRCPARCVP